MHDLKAVRQGWEEAEAIELRLLRSMTAQESFLHWLLLQRLFEPQLRETWALFGPERHPAHSLRQFEQALDESTLVAEYTRLRAGKR